MIDEIKNGLKDSLNDMLLAFVQKNKEGATEQDIENWVEARDSFIDDIEELMIHTNIDMESTII